MAENREVGRGSEAEARQRFMQLFGYPEGGFAFTGAGVREAIGRLRVNGQRYTERYELGEINDNNYLTAVFHVMNNITSGEIAESYRSEDPTKVMQIMLLGRTAADPLVTSLQPPSPMGVERPEGLSLWKQIMGFFGFYREEREAYDSQMEEYRKAMDALSAYNENAFRAAQEARAMEGRVRELCALDPARKEAVREAFGTREQREALQQAAAEVDGLQPPAAEAAVAGIRKYIPDYQPGMRSGLGLAGLNDPHTVLRMLNAYAATRMTETELGTATEEQLHGLGQDFAQVFKLAPAPEAAQEGAEAENAAAEPPAVTQEEKEAAADAVVRMYNRFAEGRVPQLDATDPASIRANGSRIAELAETASMLHSLTAGGENTDAAFAELIAGRLPAQSLDRLEAVRGYCTQACSAMRVYAQDAFVGQPGADAGSLAAAPENSDMLREAGNFLLFGDRLYVFGNAPVGETAVPAASMLQDMQHAAGDSPADLAAMFNGRPAETIGTISPEFLTATAGRLTPEMLNGQVQQQLARQAAAERELDETAALQRQQAEEAARQREAAAQQEPLAANPAAELNTPGQDPEQNQLGQNLQQNPAGQTLPGQNPPPAVQDRQAPELEQTGTEQGRTGRQNPPGQARGRRVQEDFDDEDGLEMEDLDEEDDDPEAEEEAGREPDEDEDESEMGISAGADDDWEPEKDEYPWGDDSEDEDEMELEDINGTDGPENRSRNVNLQQQEVQQNQPGQNQPQQEAQQNPPEQNQQQVAQQNQPGQNPPQEDAEEEPWRLIAEDLQLNRNVIQALAETDPEARDSFLDRESARQDERLKEMAGLKLSDELKKELIFLSPNEWKQRRVFLFTQQQSMPEDLITKENDLSELGVNNPVEFQNRIQSLGAQYEARKRTELVADMRLTEAEKSAMNQLDANERNRYMNCLRGIRDSLTEAEKDKRCLETYQKLKTGDPKTLNLVREAEGLDEDELMDEETQELREHIQTLRETVHTALKLPETLQDDLNQLPMEQWITRIGRLERQAALGQPITRENDLSILEDSQEFELTLSANRQAYAIEAERQRREQEAAEREAERQRQEEAERQRQQQRQQEREQQIAPRRAQEQNLMRTFIVANGNFTSGQRAELVRTIAQDDRLNNREERIQLYRDLGIQDSTLHDGLERNFNPEAREAFAGWVINAALHSVGLRPQLSRQQNTQPQAGAGNAQHGSANNGQQPVTTDASANQPRSRKSNVRLP